MPGDKIIITGFHGIMTSDELRKRFGDEIANIYLSYPGHVNKKFTDQGHETLLLWDADKRLDKRLDSNVKIENDISLWGKEVAVNSLECIHAGRIITKKHFSRIVSEVKNAGKLLSEIIRSVGGEEKNIKI
jgi:hypothetical protein